MLKVILFRLSGVLVVCTNHGFKWRGYEEIPTVLGPLVDQFSNPVQQWCSLYIYLNVVSPYPKIRTSCTHKIV